VGTPPLPLCGSANQVDTSFDQFLPVGRPNSLSINLLRLVDRFSQLVSTCAAENLAFSHSGDPRWLTPEAKSGVAVNLVSIPAVMVDIVQFNLFVKEQM